MNQLSATGDIPVLVVGAGPVGLSTAFFLTVHGVRPLVVERRDATGQRPRSNTSPRTIELFRAAGLGQALDRVGWTPRDPYSWVLKDSGVGSVLGRSQLPPRYHERLMNCTPAPRLWVTSDQLERLLVAEIAAQGGEVRFNAEVVEVNLDRGQVRATVVDPTTDERSHIACSYLVGADGANSVVRAQTGITMPDREVVGAVYTAFYRARIINPGYERDTRFCFVLNDQIYAAIGSVNGDDLWGTHIMDYPDKPDHRVRLSDEQVTTLLHTAIGDPTVDIELFAAHPWEATHGVASRFRKDRVFLVGDAAHLQTSASGLGMNTGIQDGHNLAWKLATVLHGHAPASLLDTYEAERQPAAATSVDFSRMATSNVGIGTSDQARLQINDGHAEAQLRAMMFYRYHSAAIITGDPPEQELDVYHDKVQPGYRLPHHWLISNDTRTSTTDLPGPEWLLLAGPQGHPWISAAASLDIAVRAYRITDGDGDGDGDGDTLADPDGRFREIAGMQPDGAVLVRPDGFVAWHTNTVKSAHPQESLREAITRVLGLTTRSPAPEH